MNFTPPLQLCFPFVEQSGPEAATPWQRAGMGRSAYFGRRKLRRAVAVAYELGRRRKPVAASPMPTLHPARKPQPFQPTHAEAAELQALARRIERLTISRTHPEKFHEDKGEIAHELRVIASRSSCVKVL
jgi:hypothetical protein